MQRNCFATKQVENPKLENRIRRIFKLIKPSINILPKLLFKNDRNVEPGWGNTSRDGRLGNFIGTKSDIFPSDSSKIYTLVSKKGKHITRRFTEQQLYGAIHTHKGVKYRVVKSISDDYYS